MGVSVEWTEATYTTAELLAPGDDWVGADDQDEDKYVLAISSDEVTAVEGTPEQLRALAHRILRVTHRAPGGSDCRKCDQTTH